MKLKPQGRNLASLVARASAEVSYGLLDDKGMTQCPTAGFCPLMVFSQTFVAGFSCRFSRRFRVWSR
jgi:hypothetical protein